MQSYANVEVKHSQQRGNKNSRHAVQDMQNSSDEYYNTHSKQGATAAFNRDNKSGEEPAKSSDNKCHAQNRKSGNDSSTTSLQNLTNHREVYDKMICETITDPIKKPPSIAVGKDIVSSDNSQIQTVLEHCLEDMNANANAAAVLEIINPNVDMDIIISAKPTAIQSDSPRNKILPVLHSKHSDIHSANASGGDTMSLQASELVNTALNCQQANTSEMNKQVTKEI